MGPIVHEFRYGRQAERYFDLLLPVLFLVFLSFPLVAAAAIIFCGKFLASVQTILIVLGSPVALLVGYYPFVSLVRALSAVRQRPRFVLTSDELVLPNRFGWWKVPEYVIPYASILDVEFPSEGAGELAELVLCGPIFPAKLYGSMNVEIRKRDFASGSDFDTLCQLVRREALRTRQRLMQVPSEIPGHHHGPETCSIDAPLEDCTRVFRLGWCGLDFFVVVGFFSMGTIVSAWMAVADDRPNRPALLSYILTSMLMAVLPSYLTLKYVVERCRRYRITVTPTSVILPQRNAFLFPSVATDVRFEDILDVRAHNGGRQSLTTIHLELADGNTWRRSLMDFRSFNDFETVVLLLREGVARARLAGAVAAGRNAKARRFPPRLDNPA
jgi:hypothetical protein